MSQSRYDVRADRARLVRDLARIELRLAKIIDHFDIPDISDEEVDKILAEEGIARPVKSPTTAASHLSTGESVVHK